MSTCFIFFFFCCIYYLLIILFRSDSDRQESSKQRRKYLEIMRNKWRSCELHILSDFIFLQSFFPLVVHKEKQISS